MKFEYEKTWNEDSQTDIDTLVFAGSALLEPNAPEELSTLTNALSHLHGFEAMGVLSPDWAEFIEHAQQNPKKHFGVFVSENGLGWSRIVVKRS